ncbi:pom121-like protein 2 [Lasius niger]|uniref:Pom121-like protein 2 n=1 Tax=Lasius niger TaxID=67767 RepID=A0A0J7NDY1_LASNI|nr:pom121-like protein 2 [Lasius niger]
MSDNNQEYVPLRQPHGSPLGHLPIPPAAAGTGAIPRRPAVGADVPPPNPEVPASEVEPPPAGLYGDLGICNNQFFLRHYIAGSPVTAALKFAPLQRWPILPPYDDKFLLSLAHVFAKARYHAANIPNPPLRKAIAVGKALSPMIPNHKFETTLNSRTSFVEWIKRGFLDNIMLIRFREIREVNTLRIRTLS